MSVRCLITDGKNYEQNKQFVEDALKYFPDYDFNIMKATISGWQSSQLKDNEDRLPTIQELIDYLQNSAKRENNNNIKIIADKAQQILNNLSTYDKELQDTTSDYKFRDKLGEDISNNEQAFKARFQQQQTQTQQQIQPESQPITTEQLNEPQQFNEEKIKATRDFLNPVTR